MEKTDLLKELRIERDVEEPASRRRWPIVAAIVVMLASGGAVWFALSGPSALVVTTAVARSMPAAVAGASVLDATGYVTARREATVSAQITGTLTEVLIEEGDHVKEGQVIARLDDTAQKASLAQAQAGLHAAQATLVEYQAQLEQARRDWKRAADMVGRKLVSQQAVEQAHTQVETLAAQVAAQRRQIDVAEAAVRSAQVQLDYCTVRAPFAGVVIAKAAQVGEIVSPFSAGGGFTRTGVGTIVDMDSLEVEVDVNEAYIGRVVTGAPVESVLNAYPDWKIPSHVIAIIPTADRSKATVKVRVGLDVKDPRIVPDMGVRVSFLEEKKAGAAEPKAARGVLVPSGALVRDGDTEIVYVVRNDKAQRRAVSLGGTVGDSRQVLAGVSAGDTVVVDVPAQLKDGMAVKVAR